MAAEQKCGVIIVTVMLIFLQKIKTHNYRLYILLEETQKSDAVDFNLTKYLNSTSTMFERENVTKFMFYCLLVGNCFSTIPCLFLTSWSDKHGRKLLLTLPFIGSLIGDAITFAILTIPTATSKFILISEGINGFFGGTILMVLGCLCYITDSTDHRQRTLLIALFLGLYNTVPAFDMSLQYYYTPLLGLSLRTLIICALLYRMISAVLYLVYVRLCVNETIFVLGTYDGNPWINLLTPINVSDTISCVFKRRMDNMRLYIVVLTVIFIFYTVSLFGNIITFPLYFRDQYSWPYEDQMLFLAIFNICQSLVLWLSMYFASEWQFFDSDLGTVGSLSLGISCLNLIIAREDYIAAIGALVGVCSLFVPVTIISVLSKLVERDETGSMYAGIGFLTLMTQLIASLSYSTLYDICEEAGMPQLVFLLSFGLICFCLFFFVYLKKNISPHLLGHLKGKENLSLINRKGQVEKLFE